VIRALVLVGMLAAPVAAQTTDALLARIAELEAQLATQAETIGRLTAERDARLTVQEGETLRTRILNQTQRLGTLSGDVESCRRDLRSATADLARARDDAARFRTEAQTERSRAQTAERGERSARDAQRRAESDVRRLRSDLMRCR
jgi:uncharacterized coiled-coil protein SlyX